MRSTVSVFKQAVGIMLLLGGLNSLQATESWIGGEATGIYWFYADSGTFGRGHDLRDNPTATSGTATTTEEKLNRVTGQWAPYVANDEERYYLDTSSGTWVADGASYEFNITGSNHEIMEVSDGYARLDNIVDLAGEPMPIPACFGLPEANFSAGAKRYALSWKAKELYELDRVPMDWSQQPPQSYSALDDFVNAHDSFLHNDDTGEDAGFRLDANLSDGSGDLVVLIRENDGTQNEGRKIGDWTLSNLPGQETNSSIIFTFTDSGFLDDDDDSMFATVHDGKVWIGGHTPAGSDFESVDDEIYNEEAYNQMVTVIDSNKSKLAKLITCDLIDRKFQYQMNNSGESMYVSFLGNMNYLMKDENDNLVETGTWSVLNGVVIRDEIENDINKTLNVEKVDFSSLMQNGHSVLTHIESGRGTIESEQGEVWRSDHLPETEIPHVLTYEEIKGKKINLTYTDNEGSESVNVSMYPNMTFAADDSVTYFGVWRIENGVLVLDAYYDEEGAIEIDTESWVFDDATHAKTYVGGQQEATITINSVTDLTNVTPVDNPFTLEMLLGKVVTIGDQTDQTKLYFYEDMTFKGEGHDDSGNLDIFTGTWQVVEGVLVIDIVISDDTSKHLAITRHNDDDMTIDIAIRGTDQNEDKNNISVLDVSNIPSSSGEASLPPVIMYLLN